MLGSPLDTKMPLGVMSNCDLAGYPGQDVVMRFSNRNKQALI